MTAKSHDHAFCRELLADMRKEAKEVSFKIPKHMTALKSGKQFFVEAEGVYGSWIKACCAYDAKNQFIQVLMLEWRTADES